MRLKPKLICQIIAVIISFIVIVSLIIYVAVTVNKRPRTPDGTIPTRGEREVYTIKGDQF